VHGQHDWVCDGPQIETESVQCESADDFAIFSIQTAVRDLKDQPVKPFSQPVKPFSQAWPETIAWFKEHGPGFWEQQAEKKSGKTGGVTVVPNTKED
jgi:hypothetical protein